MSIFSKNQLTGNKLIFIEGKALRRGNRVITPEIFKNIFSHRCRSKQIFGSAKDFCPNFPKLAQKVVGQLLPTVFVV